MTVAELRNMLADFDAETGHCVDFVLRDFNGHDIDDDALIEDIQEQIDNP